MSNFTCEMILKEVREMSFEEIVEIREIFRDLAHFKTPEDRRAAIDRFNVFCLPF